MSESLPRMLVDGEPHTHVPVSDRGLCYGDGLFETLRWVHGRAPLWERHMHRLAEGCARLALPAPDASRLWREVGQAAQGMAQAVVRIILTRGDGPRGYAPPRPATARRIVVASPLPVWVVGQGLRVRWCALRLAEQPALAGIKHLNRLEQVLARAEWDDHAIAEGLLCDHHDRVVSATAANLFAVIQGELCTPSLDRCGVAGVARAEILAVRSVCVRDLKRDDVAGADELFLSSSVRGILPVRALEERVYAVGPVARALQAHWRTLGFPLEGG